MFQTKAPVWRNIDTFTICSELQGFVLPGISPFRFAAKLTADTRRTFKRSRQSRGVKIFAHKLLHKNLAHKLGRKYFQISHHHCTCSGTWKSVDTMGLSNSQPAFGELGMTHIGNHEYIETIYENSGAHNITTCVQVRLSTDINTYAYFYVICCRSQNT